MNPYGLPFATIAKKRSYIHISSMFYNSTTMFFKVMIDGNMKKNFISSSELKEKHIPLINLILEVMRSMEFLEHFEDNTKV